MRITESGIMNKGHLILVCFLLKSAVKCLWCFTPQLEEVKWLLQEFLKKARRPPLAIHYLLAPVGSATVLDGAGSSCYSSDRFLRYYIQILNNLQKISEEDDIEYHALPKSKVFPLLSVVDWYAGVLDAEVQYALCWAESYWSVQSIASINACCVFRDVHWISAEIADTCTMCWTLGSSDSHGLISRESRSGTPHDAF